MAIGDRITGSRETSLMRRINALEDTLTWGSGGTLTSTTYDDIAVSRDGDGNTYGVTDSASPTVIKINNSTGSETTIVSNGTADGNVYRQHPDSFCEISYANGLVFVGDTTEISGTKYYRLQSFDTSGTNQWTYKVSTATLIGYPRFGKLQGMNNGACYALVRTGSSSRKMIYVSQAGSPTDLWSYNTGDTGTGDIIGGFPGCQISSNHCAIGVQKYNAHGECRVYNGGSLQSTYNLTSYNVSTDIGDSFTQPWKDSITTSGLIYSNRMYYSGGVDLGYGGLNLDTLGNALGDGPTRGALAANVSGIDENDRYYTHTPGGGISYVDKTADTQTTFYKYLRRGSSSFKTSLGTPDYGYSIPADDALDGAIVHSEIVNDMRSVIEGIAGDYINPATGNSYTTSVAGADNIFRLAIDSGQDDWTDPTDPSVNTRFLESYYDDIELVLSRLEASERV